LSLGSKARGDKVGDSLSFDVVHVVVECLSILEREHFHFASPFSVELVRLLRRSFLVT